MSDYIADKLYDQVAELVSYWEGTLWARMLERDLDTNDMEALHFHAQQAYAEMRLQEDLSLGAGDVH
jgi:hypothetical protein